MSDETLLRVELTTAAVLGSRPVSTPVCRIGDPSLPGDVAVSGRPAAAGCVGLRPVLQIEGLWLN